MKRLKQNLDFITMKVLGVMVLLAGISTSHFSFGQSLTQKLAAGLTSGNSSKPQYGFIENKGQIQDQNQVANPEVKYVLSLPGNNIVLKATGFSYDTYVMEERQPSKETLQARQLQKGKFKDAKEYNYKYHRVDVVFDGANANPEIVADEQSADYIMHHANMNGHGVKVYHYGKVTYKDIYPGIDVEFIARPAGSKPVEYNFIVHPGADLNQIQLRYSGANESKLNNGNLELTLAHGKLTESIPASYWRGNKKQASIHYKHLRGKGDKITVGFEGETKSTTETLIIDPTPDIEWATYFGGTGDETMGSVVVDKNHNLYIIGTTSSYNLPATTNTYQNLVQDDRNVFISKFDLLGELVWSCYYGGDSQETYSSGCIDASGFIYVLGNTSSQSSIATNSGFQTTLGGYQDSFIAKFDGTGQLTWGSYFGGESFEVGNGCSFDPSGYINITGVTFSQTGIASVNSYQSALSGRTDAFLAKFDLQGGLQWSTYFGGTNTETAYTVSNDYLGNVYIAGGTSSNSIATQDAYQTQSHGGSGGLVWPESFLAKFSSQGSLTWSTYFGGYGDDIINSCSTDNNNNIYITGSTTSSDYIASSNGSEHQTFLRGYNDIFVSKFAPGGEIQWSTYYGGSNTEYSTAVTTDSFGGIFITGNTNSYNYISSSDAYQTTNLSGDDAFFSKFDQNGQLVWGSYFGKRVSGYFAAGYGICIDSSTSNIFLAGEVADPSNSNSQDVFLAKIGQPTAPTAFSVSISGSGSYCPGGSGVTVSLSGSQVGVNYQLLVSGGGSSIKAGTGAILNWTGIVGSGPVTITGTDASSGLTTPMTGSPSITMLPLPTTYTVGGGGSYCEGTGGAIVTLSNSQNGVNYQLIQNGSPLGSPQAGLANGEGLNWANQLTGSYQVLATNATTGCQQYMQNSVSVTLNASNVGLQFTYDKTSHTFTPVVSNPQNRNITSYSWFFDDGSNSTAQSPVHAYTSPGSYNVILQVGISYGQCSNVITSQKRITIDPTYDICQAYDANNSTIQLFTVNVDLNQQVQQCMANQAATNAILTQAAVNKLLEQQVSNYYNQYSTQCLQNVKENLTYTYVDKEYHYTLYYYDQSANLVQTVPPQGVHPLTAAQTNSFLAGAKTEPAHTLLTRYQYNSLNQLIDQTTPDAGESKFWYNDKGQLRVSQNAQQLIDNKYSYTKYDEQGRIVEVGEVLGSMFNLQNSQVWNDSIDSQNFPAANVYAVTDVTKTHYDAADGKLKNFEQDNLRSRVSYVEVIDKNATDTTRTHYSYDIHGNVKSLLQNIPGLKPKQTDYIYDLVSGKVNYVMYQFGQPDQFVHRYKYDADNRITDVLTSSDRFIWNEEANYSYYLHGPLARTELGHYRVQGLDYYYTLQGWIKGVNMPYAGDPGADGLNGSVVGKDVFAYNLGYYQGDYTPINTSVVTSDTRDQLWSRALENIQHTGLYNGNISWMTTDLPKIGAVNHDPTKGMQGMLYRYDQLHRITRSRSLTSYSAAGGFAVRPITNAYDEDYSYDANGNILTLKRNDDAAALKDNFAYSYYANTNKLLQHKASGGTYTYDAIGNLTVNNNEGVTLAWTPYGKVRSVTKGDTVTSYRYDGSGNRIEKKTVAGSKTTLTHYLRDAGGNVMSIYKDTVAIELPIYGSARVGQYKGGVAEGYRTLGLRNFELSNHLGNVLAVITDNAGLKADSTWASVVSTSDYYPFGLEMKARSWSDTVYRYGFNGKEKDKAFSSSASYDYGFRVYDPNIGKFLSVDPLTKSYPWYTPYQFAGNKPIWAIDLDGLEERPVTSVGDYQKKFGYFVIPKTAKQHEIALEINTKMRETLMHTYHFALTKEGKVVVNRQEALAQIKRDGYTDVTDRLQLYESSAITVVKSFPKLFGHYYQNREEKLNADFEREVGRREELEAMRNPQGSGIGDAGDLTGKVGLMVEVTGWGLTGTGIGAEVGTPLVGLGKGLQYLGDAMETLDAYRKGDNDEVTRKISISIGSEIIGFGAGKKLVKGTVGESVVQSVLSTGTEVTDESTKRKN